MFYLKKNFFSVVKNSSTKPALGELFAFSFSFNGFFLSLLTYYAFEFNIVGLCKARSVGLVYRSTIFYCTQRLIRSSMLFKADLNHIQTTGLDYAKVGPRA